MENMAKLAAIATARSCGAGDFSELSGIGHIKASPDGWFDLTDAGREALRASGYAYDPRHGWVMS